MTKYNKKDDYSEISWEFPNSLKQDYPKSEEKEEMSIEDLGEKLITLAIVCPTCKKSFLYKGHPRKYCSNECSEKMRQRVRHSKIPLFTILSRDGFRCHYCGKSPHMHPNVILIVEHITPLSKGGTSTEENLITSCLGCNAGKGSSLLDSKVIAFLKGEQGSENDPK